MSAPSSPSSSGFDLDETFVALVKSFDLQELGAFLQEHPDFDVNVAQVSFGDKKFQFATALQWVVLHNSRRIKFDARADVARLLLKHGADVNADADSNGNTLLHRCPTATEVNLVLDMGANIHSQNNVGETPLAVAARGGRVSVVKTLLERGADPNLPDVDGDTPLHSFINHLVKFRPTDVRSCWGMFETADADPLLCNRLGVPPIELLYTREKRRQHQKTKDLLRGSHLARLGSELSFARRMSCLFKDQSCDITMEFAPYPSDPGKPGRKYKVHRLVLEASSEKFRAMFRSNLQEASTGVIKIDQPFSIIYDALLQFMYGDRVRLVDFESFCELARLSDQYLMDDLKRYCERQLVRWTGKTTVVRALLLAGTLRMPTLKAAACHYVVEHFDSMHTEEEFIQLLELPEGAALVKDVLEARRVETTRKRKYHEESDSTAESDSDEASSESDDASSD